MNGTILRLTAIADMELGDPILESDISVEYAPVEIGGRNYFCPVKSVSLWVASMPERHVLETLLNSSVFTEYHQFRSESRILIDGAPATP